MKIQIGLRPIGIIGLALLGAVANTQWLTTTSGNSTTRSGVFWGSISNPQYWGWVGTSISNASPGSSAGIPGLIPSATTSLTPSFLANYPVNINSNELTSLAFGYKHTRDTYHVTYDFNNMALGYLVAGTTMAILDLDITEQFTNMRAYDWFSNPFTSNWLAPYAGTKGWLDYNGPPDSTGSITQYAWSGSGGVYNFQGHGVNHTSTLLGFATTQNISRIEFDVSKYDPLSRDHQGGAGLAFAAVPEPASVLVMGTCLYGLLRRGRKR